MKDLAAELAAVRARVDELERLPAVANALSEIRATALRDAERQRIAGIATRRDYAEIAACPFQDMRTVLSQISDPVGFVVESDDPDVFMDALIPQQRERAEVRLADLGECVRVSAIKLAPGSVYCHRQHHEIPNYETYARMVGAGFAVEATNGCFAYAGPGFSAPRVYTLENFTLLHSVDAELRELLASGALTATRLTRSELEDRALAEIQNRGGYARVPLRRRTTTPEPQTTETQS